MNQSKEDEVLEKIVTAEESNEFTKVRIIRNLVVVSLTFLTFFTASEGLVSLQSTMNKEVGVISFVVQYVCGCIAALFLPKYLIRKFGSKFVLVVSMFAYIPYLSSNFYPVFGFMIPTSILVGFASSLVFNSVCTYLNDLSSLYTKLSLRNRCQNHVSNSSPQEKDVLKSHENNIFINKQSMDGENDACLINAGTINKEIALTEFKCASSLNKRLSKENMEKSNLVDETFNQQQKHDKTQYMINDKSQTILKQNFDFFKNKKKECSTTENDLSSSLFDSKAGNGLTFSGEKISESHIFSISPVLEKNLVFAPVNGIELKAINEERQDDSPAKIDLLSDDAIRVLETTTSRFFGVFGCVYQISHILCNAITYSIFQINYVDREYIHNSSCVCGSEFCSMESSCVLHNLQVPNIETRYTLTTVCVAMSFLSALFTLLFLDYLKQEDGEVSFSTEMAIMTIKFHRNKNQLLLVPVSLYLGLQQAFVTGDFTKDFIGCAWGVEHISLVVMVGGCGISLFSGLYGLLENLIGRRVFISVAAVLNFFTYAIMLFWTPDPTRPVMMFVVAGLIGSVSGIFWCQLRAFMGLIFKEEEETAFGCYQLWHALGCAVAFAYNNYICTYFKIYILLIVSTIAVVGYLLAERNYALSKKQDNKT